MENRKAAESMAKILKDYLGYEMKYPLRKSALKIDEGFVFCFITF